MAKMFYDADANLGLLKRKTVAVLGFGSGSCPGPEFARQWSQCSVGLQTL